MTITLATLPQATEQQVFDQVATHLLKQNKHCYSAAGFCAYRNREGLKCAAGCLIADDEYDVEFDSFQGGTWLKLIDAGFVPGAHAVLISRLQDVHDGRTPEDWRNELVRVAQVYNLNTDVLAQ